LQFGNLPPDVLKFVVAPMLGESVGPMAQTAKGMQAKVLPSLDQKTIADKEALVQAMCRHLTDSSKRCLSRSGWPLDEIPREWASYAQDHKLDYMSCKSYCLQEWPQQQGKAFVDTMMANMGQELAFLFAPTDPVDKVPLLTGKLLRFGVTFTKKPGVFSSKNIDFNLGTRRILYSFASFYEGNMPLDEIVGIVGIAEAQAMPPVLWRDLLFKTWKEQETKSNGRRYLKFYITLANHNKGIWESVLNRLRLGIVKQIPTDNKQVVVWPYPMRADLSNLLLGGPYMLTMNVYFPDIRS
jgi:hypothetical protein